MGTHPVDVPEECRGVLEQVFVDVEADVRLIRRIRRDMKYRGRTLESVIDQYMATVRSVLCVAIAGGSSSLIPTLSPLLPSQAYAYGLCGAFKAGS
jgi:hypothetical protein